LAEDVLTLLSQRASAEVKTALLVKPGCPTSVRGAAGSIRQVLLNLVGNALKFTERGSVVVRCSLDDGRIVYEVSDTGIGIPQERLLEIFEPFSQVDDGAGRKYQGTGLGLAITRRIVELLDGAISVDSESGVGTTFQVSIPVSAGVPESLTLPARGRALLVATSSFPLKEVMREAGYDVNLVNHEGLPNNLDGYQLIVRGAGGGPEMPAARTVYIAEKNEVMEPGKKYLRPPFSARRLLMMVSEGKQPDKYDADAEADYSLPPDLSVALADDNPINRRVTSLQLQKLKCVPALSENGSALLGILKTRRMDIVLLDLQMPVVDGYEVLRRIRENEDTYGRPVVIALTAHAGGADRERCLKLGFNDYLAKPLSARDLYKLLQDWARRIKSES
jgi:CheY-like chemotaxis protein/anti-sigma regulatory factor (Ser/Thr protein kinase)